MVGGRRPWRECSYVRLGTFYICFFGYQGYESWKNCKPSCTREKYSLFLLGGGGSLGTNRPERRRPVDLSSGHCFTLFTVGVLHRYRKYHTILFFTYHTQFSIIECQPKHTAIKPFLRASHLSHVDRTGHSPMPSLDPNPRIIAAPIK